MPFDVTILTKKIEGIKQAFENGRFADALVGALNTGSGLMQQRIFTENVDIQGNSFGQYIGIKHKVQPTSSGNALAKKRAKAIAGLSLTTYQKKRASKGRQILKKDLELTGGTRRAIEPKIENEKAAVLEFNNDEAAKIAKGQEQQITNIRNGQKGTTKGTGAVKIFRLNKSEKEQVTEQGRELLIQILKPKQ